MNIRTSKDIPDEIKGLVEQFYMQGLDVALASVPGLKHAKPELIPLIECTLQLFENAPDSVFMFYDELIAAYAAQDMSIDLDFSVSDWMDEQNFLVEDPASISPPATPENFPPSGPTAEQPAIRLGTIEAPDQIQHTLHDDAEIKLSELLAAAQEHSRLPAFKNDSPKKRNKTMFFGGDLLSEEEVHQRIQSANIDHNNESIHCIKTPLPSSFSSKTPVPKAIQTPRFQSPNTNQRTPLPGSFRTNEAHFEKNDARSLVSDTQKIASNSGSASIVENDFEFDFGKSRPALDRIDTKERRRNSRDLNQPFSFTPPPPLPNRPRRNSFHLDLDDDPQGAPERDIDFASLSNSSLNIFEDKPAQEKTFRKPAKPNVTPDPPASDLHARNLAAIMSDFSDSAPRSTIPSLSALSSSAHMHSLKRQDISKLGRDLSKVGDPNERSNIGRFQKNSDKRPTKPSGEPLQSTASSAESPLEKLAPLSRTPALKCKLSEIITRKDISSRAGFIISMIDGITTLQDILDLSAWSAEETADILLELERMHIVSFY